MFVSALCVCLCCLFLDRACRDHFSEKTARLWGIVRLPLFHPPSITSSLLLRHFFSSLLFSSPYQFYLVVFPSPLFFYSFGPSYTLSSDFYRAKCTAHCIFLHRLKTHICLNSILYFQTFIPSSASFSYLFFLSLVSVRVFFASLKHMRCLHSFCCCCFTVKLFVFPAVGLSAESWCPGVAHQFGQFAQHSFLSSFSLPSSFSRFLVLILPGT